MRCSICGCTDLEPCFDEDFERACGWASAGLCTFCDEADSDYGFAPRTHDEFVAGLAEGRTAAFAPSRTSCDFSNLRRAGFVMP